MEELGECRSQAGLDEQLHPSSPSALLSWVSVPKRGQGKSPSQWPLLCKIVLLLDKVASSKDEAIYLPEKACSDIAQGIAQNERKAMTIAGWARFPGERWELRMTHENPILPC